MADINKVKNIKLSVIIVNYNVKGYVEQCLGSLMRALSGIDSEVFVVDNHSQDGSVDYLSARFPEVRIVSSNHNLGFARANNIAIRQSSGEYVLLLNPDTIVGEDTLRDTLAFMDTHLDGGALGVRMLTVTGASAKESRRGLPSPMVSFCKMVGLCDRFPKNRRLGHYYMGYLPWNEAASIEVVSGAFCLLRRSAIERVGLLDESFFMYGEDIDLSYRILKGGYRNYYYPSFILHYKGESTHKSSFNYVHVFYEAMFIFFRKHYSGMSLLLSLPIKTAIYAKAFVALVGMMGEKLRKRLGFFTIQKEYPRYVFVGGEKMLEECRIISLHRGLDAIYIKGDEHTLPDGHLSPSLASEFGTDAKLDYVVYDVDAYSYKRIFSIFASAPSERKRIGTYNVATHKIITESEIIE